MTERGWSINMFALSTAWCYTHCVDLRQGDVTLTSLSVSFCTTSSRGLCWRKGAGSNVRKRLLSTHPEVCAGGGGRTIGTMLCRADSSTQ